MTSWSFKITTSIIIFMLTVIVVILMQSCEKEKKNGDYYYDLAMQSLANDSIEEAFCQIDKALSLYAQEDIPEKEENPRIILAMLYFSNNLKDKAYDLIKDLDISPDDTSNYLFKSNYFRIKAYYKSLIERDNQEALKSIDVVINNDTLLNEHIRKPHLVVDMLNKTEFLLNADKVDEARTMLEKIEKMVVKDSLYFPQLYVNKARVMEAKGLNDSAYIYSELVEKTTRKVYQDGDNLLAALAIMMRYDSLNNNLYSYISHRNSYEDIIRELNVDKNRLRMELQSNRNKMEMAELNHTHQYQMYVMWTILVVCTLLIITLMVVSKYQTAKKQRQLIQMECEKLDAECFKRKLECELYSRKMEAKDEEMRKINQDLLDLSYKLTHIHEYSQPESTEATKDHLARLQRKVQSDHPDFCKNMTLKFPTITKTEMVLAELIRLNLTTDEITSLLNITQAGLIKSRYRLRKRLGVASSSELDSFIASV